MPGNVITTYLAEIGADVTGFHKGLSSVDRGLGGLTGTLTKVGAAIGVTFSFGAIIKSAGDFDASLKNIQATAMLTDKQMKSLNSELLAIGKDATDGPQGVAQAYYTVVGGLTDASARMETLKQSVATAEAGQANLERTTEGLVYTMNAYNFTAKEASFVSDVFTRTVGVGVGTMEQFIGAIAPISGMASTLGVKFDDLGSSTAYLTTKGVSASEAATQLSGIMTSLLKPTDAMTKQLTAIGYSSGSAAIKALGLTGTVQKLSQSVGGNSDQLAEMFGRVEALRGAMVLSRADALKFGLDFGKGLNGATAAARKIQLGGFNAQLAKLRSNISVVAIQVGQKLLPSLTKVASFASKAVGMVAAGDWKGLFTMLSGVSKKILAFILNDVVGPIVSRASQAAKEVFEVIVQTIATGLTRASAAAKTIFDGITQTISDGFGRASVAAKIILDSIVQFISDGFGRAQTAASQLVSLFTLGVVGALNTAATSASNLASVLKTELVTVIGQIDPQVFGYVAVGIGAVALVLAGAKVAVGISAMAEAIRRMGTFSLAALGPMLPMAGVIAVIAGITYLAATNTGGFGDRLKELGEWLRKLSPAAQGALLVLVPTALLFTKLVAGAVISTLASHMGMLAGAVWALSTPLFVILSPLILAGALFLAYQNNLLGMKDAVDKLGKSLRLLAEDLGLVNDRAKLPGGVTLLEKMIPGFKNPFVTDEAGKRLDGGRFVQSGTGRQPTNGFIPLPPGPAPMPTTSSQMLQSRLLGRDSGGMGEAGKPYLIGTGAQPEMFVPRSSGMFYPAGSGSYNGPKSVQVNLIAESFVDYVMVQIAEAQS